MRPAGETGDRLLRVSGLTVRFGGLVAVDNVSMDVRRGAIQGLIGPNGAGKTTLFNVLSGIVRPADGTVEFDGKSCTGLPAFRLCEMGISRTFQNIRILGDMTVVENVQTGMHTRLKSGFVASVTRSRAFRDEEARARRRSARLLEFVGLDGVKDELARNLPYGLQRRLEIARALASEPALLLLDEPSAGLNTGEKVALSRLIRTINEDFGKTILLIEHDMRLAMSLCETIVVLTQGQKVMEGTPSEVQRDPRVIEAYLGRGYKRGDSRA